MIAYRHADHRLPFLWEGEGQPRGRWNGEGDGPVQYFADTPDGAWAEFLRHEEIKSPEDIATITRVLWVVDLPDQGYGAARLPDALLTGGAETYEACRGEARRLRSLGFDGLVAPTAALVDGGAGGWRVEAGLTPGPPRGGRTLVLLGHRPELVGWRAAVGRPHEDLLSKVRHYVS